MEYKYKERKPTYNKSYYNKHKDRLLENMKKTITCDCGCVLTAINIHKHLRSNKHKKRMEAIVISNSESNSDSISDSISDSD